MLCLASDAAPLAERARKLEGQGPGGDPGSLDALAAALAATLDALRALARA